MKNKLEDLRDHLFETIEGLKDDKNPMDVKRASAIKGVAETIISSARVELDFMELTGNVGSGFLPNREERGLPELPRPRLVNGGGGRD